MNIFIGILLIFALLGPFDKLFGETGPGRRIRFRPGVDGLPWPFPSWGSTASGSPRSKANRRPSPPLPPTCPLTPPSSSAACWPQTWVAMPSPKEMAATPAPGDFLRGNGGFQPGRHHLLHFLPVALTTIRKEDTAPLCRGIVRGIVTIPAGVVAGALLTGLPMGILIRNLLPILLLCAGICLFLPSRPKDVTIRVLSALGNPGADCQPPLCPGDAGVFLPSYQIVSDDLFFESLTIVIKIARWWWLGRWWPLPLILRYFYNAIARIADRLGINAYYGGWGLIASPATCISMIPMLDKMDQRGRGDECCLCSQRGLCSGGTIGLYGQCRTLLGGLCLHGGQVGPGHLCGGCRHGLHPKSSALPQQ